MKHSLLKWLTSGLALILFSIFLYACARNPVTGKKEIMLISESQELAMGLESDPAIIANFGMYNNENLQNFINEKGKAMAAISHRSELDFKFRILDSPVVNAFAVPGGYVYFTRGIMAHFNNEAEFAGVLGHEIGHITARHSARQLSKQQLYTGLLIGGMIVSEDFRKFSDMAQQGLGLLFLKFGRDDESQSDLLGVEYSTQVGYDAHEMANFFGVLDRLQQKSGQSIPDFLSTHPNPADRYNRVHQLATQYQTEANKSNLTVNRDSYLRMIDGIVYGEDPRQGYVEDFVFYHPELKFKFPVPGNWQVVNTPQMVQIVEPNGKAVMLFTLAQEKTLDEAAKATIERDQLKVVESSKVKVNGLPGIAMISEQITQNQQTGQEQALRILTYLIQYNGLIYKLHGLSTRQDFNAYFNLFSNTMSNFSELTDLSKINVQPEIVKIRTVSRQSTLAEAFNSFGVPTPKQEDLAILNNMKLTDVLPSGTLIKTIVKGTANTD